MNQKFITEKYILPMIKKYSNKIKNYGTEISDSSIIFSLSPSNFHYDNFFVILYLSYKIFVFVEELPKSSGYLYANDKIFLGTDLNNVTNKKQEFKSFEIVEKEILELIKRTEKRILFFSSKYKNYLEKKLISL